MKITAIVLLWGVSLVAGSAVKMADYLVKMEDKERLRLEDSDNRLLYNFLMAKPFHKFETRLSTYIFTNCGDPKKEMLVINDLVISPDPLPSKGTINITFNANVTAQIVAPVQASLTIQKTVFGFWITVPCVDNFGSCDYPDFCQILGNGSCPQPFVNNNIPCHCPFAVGNYSLPGISLDVDIGVLPSGGYKARLDLNTATEPVGCYEVQFSLS